jgi:DNA-directed RNA polymerase specialized sigma24 family protein
LFESEPDMTREEYGNAYERGFTLTVRFLVSRGLFTDAAEETAQAAWTKGWERLAQLRNESMLMTWVNSIALNLYRSIRRKPLLQPLPDLSAPPKVNLAAIDINRLLLHCKLADRVVLQRRYLEGWGIRDIARVHGWTETAVRIRLVRARRSAKARMDDRCLRFHPKPLVSHDHQTGMRHSAAA